MSSNKTTSIPFHYEVRFRLLSYNSSEDIKIQTHKKAYYNENPLVAREEAFEAFDDYVSFLKKKDKVIDNKGKLKIASPVDINALLKDKILGIEEHQILSKYYQEIAIYLVLDDTKYEAYHNLDNYSTPQASWEVSINKDRDREIENLKDLNLDETNIFIFNYHKYQTPIHIISTDWVDADDILLSLENEYEFYSKLGYDTSNNEITVEFRGDDYSDVGNDTESAYHKILWSPIKWELYSVFSAEDDVVCKESETHEAQSIKELLVAGLQKGEGKTREYKSSLLFDFDHKKKTIRVLYKNAKAICSFLNTNGGVLYIGVRNNRNIQGLEYDYGLFEGDKYEKQDSLKNQFDGMISHFFFSSVRPLLNTHIIEIEGKDILAVIVQKSDKPVFLQNREYDQETNAYTKIKKEFYYRGEVSSREIKDIEEIVEYILSNWGK